MVAIPPRAKTGYKRYLAKSRGVAATCVLRAGAGDAGRTVRRMAGSLAEAVGELDSPFRRKERGLCTGSGGRG